MEFSILLFIREYLQLIFFHIAIVVRFCYIPVMTKDNTNKSLVADNARLQNEVDKLSRALLEVKHGKCFYMVSSDTSFIKDGVYRTVHGQQFYCRKKDAIAFMKSAIGELPNGTEIKVNWASQTSVTCTGENIAFSCRVDKINPI